MCYSLTTLVGTCALGSKMCPNSSDYSFVAHATAESSGIDCTGEGMNDDGYTTQYGSCHDSDADTTICRCGGR